MESSVKRLLAVSWCMPPMLVPRAIQVSRLLGALPSTWSADVLAAVPVTPLPGLRTDNALVERFRDAYHLHTIAYGNVVTSNSLPPQLNAMVRLRGIFNRLFGCCAVACQSSSLSIHPDAAWINAAVNRASDLILADPSRAPDILVSFAQPWLSHLAALDIRRRTGMPWVAHFSDPWVDSLYYDTVPPETLALWQKQEFAVIAEADALIFTNRHAASLVMAKYPAAWRSKAYVLPHSFVPEATLRASDVTSKRQDGVLRLVYTGDFYAGKRTPSGLLQALALLRRSGVPVDHLNLLFAGEVPEAYLGEAIDLGVADLVTVFGKVSLAEAEALARSADVLLIIDAPAEVNVFLPSKAVDYLAFNKPLIGLTPIIGATADLLRELGSPMAPPDDIEAIAAILESLLRGDLKATIGSGQLPSAHISAAKAYVAKAVTVRFCDLLDVVLRDKAKSSDGARQAHGVFDAFK